MPKSVCNYMKVLGLQLENLSRLFWILDDGWTMCAIFTQLEENVVHFTSETETHYTGQCTMDVEFYFIETILVRDYISID